MTSEMASVAFTRGMAVIGWTLQASMDFSLPVMIDGTLKICEANSTLIAVQIKNHAKKGTIVDLIIGEKKISDFPSPGTLCHAAVVKPPLYNERPYIACVMELGITEKYHQDTYTMGKVVDKTGSLKGSDKAQEAKEREAKKDAKALVPVQEDVSSLNIISPPPSRSGKLSSKAIAPYPRYNICVYGCSPTVYRCITDNSSVVHGQLLERGQVLGEHPQPKTISPVRQMKPF